MDLSFANQTGNSDPATAGYGGTFLNRAIPPPPSPPPPPPLPPSPSPLPPLSSFATACVPGSFEYALGAAPPSGEGYATSSNLQAALPPVYTPAPYVSFSGYTNYGYIVIYCPNGGYNYGYGYSCNGASITIGHTFTESHDFPGVFTSTDGDACQYGGVYSSTVTVTCGVFLAVSGTQTGCAYAFTLSTPAVCPPPQQNPVAVSITLCAGTTVANAALRVAPGSVVSIGCTLITTPPSCVLDGGGGAPNSQILSVGANAKKLPSPAWRSTTGQAQGVAGLCSWQAAPRWLPPATPLSTTTEVMVGLCTSRARPSTFRTLFFPPTPLLSGVVPCTPTAEALPRSTPALPTTARASAGFV